jgi:hypothetical protein
MSRVVYACDIGSIRARSFAWARAAPGGANPTASADINELVTRLLEDVRDGMSIALGFESPLFMPVPEQSADLSCGRAGDGNRSIFAPVGAAVATLGIHEAAWILRSIRDEGVDALTYSLDWTAWPPQGAARTLLLWEAFVSGAAHRNSHAQDAATAALFFEANEGNLDGLNAVTAVQPLNMVHAAALWAGWADDLDRLHSGCLVLKPPEAFGGSIDPPNYSLQPTALRAPSDAGALGAQQRRQA